MNINTINTSPVQTLSSDVPNETTAAETIKQKKVEPLKALKTEKIEEDSKGRISVEDAKKMADVINEQMTELQTNIGFNIREDLNSKVIVEIKNRNTDELIRQIPSEELLVIMEKMEELTGLLFDESV